MSRFIEYLNEGMLNRTLNKLKLLNPKEAKRVLRSAWGDLKKFLEENDKEDDFLQIINTQMGTTFRTLSHIDKQKMQEEKEINEDFAHFWEFFTDQLFPATSIFPTLQLWFQVDRLLDGLGADLDFKRIAIYGLLWVFLVSAKFTSMWRKWKKENTEQYEKEGKPGPFSFRH